MFGMTTFILKHSLTLLDSFLVISLTSLQKARLLEGHLKRFFGRWLLFVRFSVIMIPHWVSKVEV